MFAEPFSNSCFTLRLPNVIRLSMISGSVEQPAHGQIRHRQQANQPERGGGEEGVDEFKENILHTIRHWVSLGGGLADLLGIGSHSGEDLTPQ